MLTLQILPQVSRADSSPKNNFGLNVWYSTTFGSIHDYLNKGYDVHFEYTPNYFFDNLNEKLKNSSIPLVSKIYVSTSLDFFKFTGPKYNRQTIYGGPSLGFNHLMKFGANAIHTQLMLGLGYTHITKDSYSGNEVDGQASLSIQYQRTMNQFVLGIGPKVGTIFNKNMPLNFVGINLKGTYIF